MSSSTSLPYTVTLTLPYVDSDPVNIHVPGATKLTLSSPQFVPEELADMTVTVWIYHEDGLGNPVITRLFHPNPEEGGDMIIILTPYQNISAIHVTSDLSCTITATLE